MTTSNDQPITDQVRFTIWPTTDTSGIVTDTDDALYYLLPTLGPTATLVLHRVARHLRYTPDVTFDTAELAKTTPGAVRAWHVRLAKSDLHPDTVAKVYRLFRTMLDTAVDNELIRANPVTSRAPPSRRRSSARSSGGTTSAGSQTPSIPGSTLSCGPKRPPAFASASSPVWAVTWQGGCSHAPPRCR